MRELIKEFVAICAADLPLIEPIYEFGSLQVPGQEGFADLRPIFPGRQYIGADMREGPGVDLVLDLHDIDLPNDSAGTVLLLETLEHVEYPRLAIDEIRRILKPGGIVIASSTMFFEIHEYPHDFWRFTPEGFKSLLKKFSCSLVEFAGEAEFPHTIVSVAAEDPSVREALHRLGGDLEPWKQKWTVSPSRRLVKSFIPPILLQALRRIKG